VVTADGGVTPGELRFVDAGDVYKRGRLAGTLLRRVDRVEFAYAPSYLADPDAPAVAITLARGDALLSSGSAGAVPPFFAGLLPEGRRLGALRRVVKTSADDELTLLLAVGADTVGDVQVTPVGVAPSSSDPTLRVDDWGAVRFADLYADLTGERLHRAGAGLAGVQEKVSTAMVSVPVSRAHERFILKLEPPEYPHLVANEHFFLQAAARSGIDAAHAEIVYDVDGAPGLLVRRFDRVDDAGGPSMLALEDGCQVLGRYPADKYNLTTEEVIVGLAKVTGAPVVAARDLLRQFAFAYVTSNGDAHAKNFSVLQDTRGEWRVSPAYDVLTTHPYGDHTMALRLGGKVDESIGRDDFVALGEQVGVRPRAAERVLDDLVRAVDGWLQDLATLPFDDRRIVKLRRAITYRRDRLARTVSAA
jgi:serine/threonine-protein kinase HipA